MIRTCGAAMAAVGLLGRAAAGVIGLIVLIGVMAPSPTPEARPGPAPGSSGPPPTTVVLEVPDGKLAGHLIVVDASGRELAALTHWSNGQTALVTGRGLGPTVGCYRNDAGFTSLQLAGTAWETHIQVAADGTITTRADERLRLYPAVIPKTGRAMPPVGSEPGPTRREPGNDRADRDR